MRGSLILYLKGMRIVMFQLSGFYYKPFLGKAQPHSAVRRLDAKPTIQGLRGPRQKTKTRTTRGFRNPKL